jgi:hypothetical protein
MISPFLTKRNRNYHRLPTLKVRTPEAAAKFVSEVGFCLLFPDQRIDLPNLMEAVHGGFHPGLVEWSDEVDNVWHWHQALAAQRKIAEVHYLLNKPTLISPALLPYFIAIEGHRERAADFRTGQDADLLQQALRDMGPTPSLTLRRSVGMDGKAGHRRFDRAITHLMRELRVLKVGGVVETGTWSSSVFDIASRAFPRTLQKSTAIEPDQAREKLLWIHLRAAVAGDPVQIRKLWDWSKTDFDNAVRALLRRRKARLCSAPGISRQALIAIP